MSEEKKPYLIINEEYDEIKINIKHTKPYMKLQQENKQLKEMHETMTKYALENEVKIDKLKEVIEEVREVINGYMPDEEALCKALDEIGFILDKTKENK